MNKIVCAVDGANVTITLTPTETGYITASKCSKCGGSATIEVPVGFEKVEVPKVEEKAEASKVEVVKEEKRGRKKADA